MPLIPAHRESAIRAQFGEAGDEWLQRLPGLLAMCAERWELEFEEPFDGGLPINLVYRVKRHGVSLVLKTGYPEPELFTELTVLQRWRDRLGCVQLEDCDDTTGVMLMQRVDPGTEFRSSFRGIARSRQSIDLFGQVPVTLDPGEETGLPSYKDWMARAFRIYRKSGSGNAGFAEFSGYLEQAEEIFRTLERRVQDNALLHGDLHHENILWDLPSSSWIAIDPKGVTGPRILECGRYMHNFLEDEAPASIREVLEVRAETLSESLGFDSEEILATGFLDLVLAVSWTLNARNEVGAEVWGKLRDYAALVTMV